MNRFNYISILLIFLLAGFLGGCIEQISFDSDKSQGQLVVSGKIYDHPGPYTLQLGMTTTENTLPLPESGASVTIFNGHGQQERYIETETEGTYMLQGDVITGQRGETYHIEIELRDGRTYSSIPETIPMHTGKDEISLEPGTYEHQPTRGTVVEAEGVYIYANTQIPEHEDPLFLKWDTESLYLFRETEPTSPLGPPAKTCYVTDTINPQRISLYSTRESGSEKIERQFFGIKDVVPEQFYIRHYVNLILSSVTERRYNYWQKVDDAINQTGTIFDVPPATIPGNIQNDDGDLTEAFGYFEASAIDTTRSFLVKFDLETYIPNPCPQGFSPNSPSACSNCLELENSTLDRPSYIKQNHEE